MVFMFVIWMKLFKIILFIIVGIADRGVARRDEFQRSATISSSGISMMGLEFRCRRLAGRYYHYNNCVISKQHLDLNTGNYGLQEDGAIGTNNVFLNNCLYGNSTGFDQSQFRQRSPKIR